MAHHWVILGRKKIDTIFFRCHQYSIKVHTIFINFVYASPFFIVITHTNKSISTVVDGGGVGVGVGVDRIFLPLNIH